MVSGVTELTTSVVELKKASDGVGAAKVTEAAFSAAYSAENATFVLQGAVLNTKPTWH